MFQSNVYVIPVKLVKLPVKDLISNIILTDVLSNIP